MGLTKEVEIDGKESKNSQRCEGFSDKRASPTTCTKLGNISIPDPQFALSSFIQGYSEDKVEW